MQMSGKKIMVLVFILSGIGLLAVSLLADIIGIGDVDPEHYTFGSKQIVGALLGAIMILTGLVLKFTK